MRTLTPTEVEVLFENAPDNYYYPVIYTAVSTGLRQAELLGLRWRDVEGKPIDPCVLSHAFGRMARQANLNGVRFHDLRHTFASLMLLRGAKPKVISEALGHSSVAFTMDVYSHIIEGMQSDAMALLDEALPPGKNGVSQKINANSWKFSAKTW